MNYFNLQKDNAYLIKVAFAYILAFVVAIFINKEVFRNTEIYPTKEFIEKSIAQYSKTNTISPDLKKKLMANYGIDVEHTNNQLQFQSTTSDNYELLYYIFNDYQTASVYTTHYYNPENNNINLEQCYDLKNNCTYAFTLK